MNKNDAIGHYRILHPLGKGGMGEVYLAEDTRLKREVAIKVLPERLRNDPERLKRFRREAEAAASLKHPNIATIHALEEYDGGPNGTSLLFIVMEHVEGMSLKDVIPDGGMDVGDGDMGHKGAINRAPTFFDIFIPLADALAHAHVQGRIHRDIKPGNIMIAEDGTPKILDFGLARIIDPDPVQVAEEFESATPLGPDDETRTMDEEEQRRAAEAAQKGIQSLTRGGVLIGTPQYMSPEQAERKETDARTDLLSFSVVMYEALTGRKAFDGETVESVIGRILESEPEAATAIKPVTPYPLWQIIRQCLTKDRDARMQTARQLCNELSYVHKEIQSGTTLVDASQSVNPSIRQSVDLLRPVYAIAFAVLLVTLTATTAWLLKPVPEAPLRKFHIVGDDFGALDRPSISPDGKIIAYTQGGRLWLRHLDQVQPREVTDVEQAEEQPFWSPDGAFIGGAKLFYVSGDSLMVVKISTRGVFRVGIPRALFPTEQFRVDVSIEYDVSRDGQRFVVVQRVEEGERPSITVVQNWIREFEPRN